MTILWRRRALFRGWKLAALVTVPIAQISAQNTIWTGDGNWMDDAQWSGGIPTAASYAHISSGTPKVEGTGAAARILTVDGGVDIRTDGSIPGAPPGTLSVGEFLSIGRNAGSAGQLTIKTGGRVFSRDVVISDVAGASGTANVDGSAGGAVWENSGNFIVGGGGFGKNTATLQIVHGGVINTGGVSGTISSIGSATATGTVVVDDSTWLNRQILRVGDGGRGTLNIFNNATVKASSSFVGLGEGVDPFGLVTIDHSTWNNTADLYIGTLGIGTLNATNGSTLTSKDTRLGDALAATGSADIDASHWITEPLLVGASGKGTLLLRNNTIMNSTLATIGRFDDAVGGVTVNHSTWSISGALTVANGVSTPTRAKGTLRIENGGFVTSVLGTLASLRAASATVTVTGIHADSTPSTWNITAPNGSITVGSRGVGTLNIENGGVVRSPLVQLGAFAQAIGTLNLRGTSTARGILETGQVLYGFGGTGLLSSDGGILRATRSEPLFLRGFPTAGLVLSGEGMTIDSNSFDIATDAPMQGNGGLIKAGPGTLDLTGSSIHGGGTTVAGGRLTVTGSVAGDVFVKASGTLGGTGSVGSVTVEPGGTVGAGSSPGTLTINGGGHLTVQSGGFVAVEIGGLAPGTQYDVLNAGGTFTHNGSFVVTFLNGFGANVQPLDTFDILTAGAPISAAIVGRRVAIVGTHATFRAELTNAGKTLRLTDYAKVPATFSNWAAQYGLTGADAGPFADPNRNGLSNLLDYATGRDPTATVSSGGATTASVVEASGQKYLAVTYTRQAGNFMLPDVIYTPERTTDLAAGSWSAASLAQLPPVAGPGNLETITVRSTVPMSPGNNEEFLRLKVTAKFP